MVRFCHLWIFITDSSQRFFPAETGTGQLLRIFAVFAVAFFIRPVGGLFFGSLGDRVGRRRALALVVLLMSVSTCAIGFLPSSASAGIMAPILLIVCRLGQGFSAGGEYAGASTFLVEHAPAHRRGLYASLIPASAYAAFLSALGVPQK